MEIARDILIIISLATVTALCLSITAGVVMLLPAIRRSVRNVEKVTQNASEVTPHMVPTVVSLENTAAHLETISERIECVTTVLAESMPRLWDEATIAFSNIKDITGHLKDAAPHVVETAANVKDTTAHLSFTAKNVSEASRLLGPAGATANIAQQGIGRIGGFIRGLFRR